MSVIHYSHKAANIFNCENVRPAVAMQLCSNFEVYGNGYVYMWLVSGITVCSQ